MYALHYRDFRVVLGLSVIGAGVVAVCVWSMLGQHSSPAFLSGCHVALMSSTAVRLAGSWEALFVFDSTVFALTVSRACCTRRWTGPPSLADMPLHRVLVHDGALYFGMMALANLSNIGSFYFGGPLFRGSLSTFASCTSVTMVSRLMLNLHEQAAIGIMSDMQMDTTPDNTPLQILAMEVDATDASADAVAASEPWSGGEFQLQRSE
ncbi:hypothetical protein GGX14DRAFT_696602 [Mycena pura]|uniref:Uncharacterized protein n=1 Tax=Mycena pura TaxID=153505 RepID=A0AAD6VIT1_9AGAR|nr:hypothetical protein GGX14DRAFT_696602 [Mycena pura]